MAKETITSDIRKMQTSAAFIRNINERCARDGFYRSLPTGR
jgi:hypothetical protein